MSTNTSQFIQEWDVEEGPEGSFSYNSFSEKFSEECFESSYINHDGEKHFHEGKKEKLKTFPNKRKYPASTNQHNNDECGCVDGGCYRRFELPQGNNKRKLNESEKKEVHRNCFKECLKNLVAHGDEDILKQELKVALKNSEFREFIKDIKNNHQPNKKVSDIDGYKRFDKHSENGPAMPSKKVPTKASTKHGKHKRKADSSHRDSKDGKVDGTKEKKLVRRKHLVSPTPCHHCCQTNNNGRQEDGGSDHTLAEEEIFKNTDCKAFGDVPEFEACTKKDHCAEAVKPVDEFAKIQKESKKAEELKRAKESVRRSKKLTKDIEKFKKTVERTQKMETFRQTDKYAKVQEALKEAEDLAKAKKSVKRSMDLVKEIDSMRREPDLRGKTKADEETTPKAVNVEDGGNARENVASFKEVDVVDDWKKSSGSVPINVLPADAKLQMTNNANCTSCGPPIMAYFDVINKDCSTCSGKCALKRVSAGCDCLPSPCPPGMCGYCCESCLGCCDCCKADVKPLSTLGPGFSMIKPVNGTQCAPKHSAEPQGNCPPPCCPPPCCCTPHCPPCSCCSPCCECSIEHCPFCKPLKKKPKPCRLPKFSKVRGCCKGCGECCCCCDDDESSSDGDCPCMDDVPKPTPWCDAAFAPLSQPPHYSNDHASSPFPPYHSTGPPQHPAYGPPGHGPPNHGPSRYPPPPHGMHPGGPPGYGNQHQPGPGSECIKYGLRDGRVVQLDEREINEIRNSLQDRVTPMCGQKNGGKPVYPWFD